MYDYDRSARLGAASIGLWRFQEARGVWTLERRCAPEEADRWLALFQRDEPGAAFKLSANKPSKPPEGQGVELTRPKRQRLVRLKYTDDVVRRMLEGQHFFSSDALIEAARERGLYVTSATPQNEVKDKLRKYFEGRTAASSADAKKFDRYITLAADDVGQLRRSDVYRVLGEAKSVKELSALSAYITGKRPDLKSTVAEDAEEVTSEKGW